jgi:hypothetical protein
MTTAANIVDATRGLIDQGYRHDFRLHDGHLHDVTADRTVAVDDIVVDVSYRFEIAADGSDGSSVYALTDRKHGTKGLLIDAFDLLDAEAGAPLKAQLGAAEPVPATGAADVPTHLGLRKVTKGEFNEDPDRYVLRVGFPDFPECPFGDSFSMLGFDTAEQDYVWLATKIMRDERLVRVPFDAADIPDNA